MVKKILPFLCSLAPFYAFGAESIDIPTNPTSINLGAGQYSNVSSGTGINVGTGGINIYNLSVLNTNQPQIPTDTDGDLYILNTVSNPFGIVSGGNVSIANTLRVQAGRGLQLSGPVVVGVGNSVLADGSFTVSGATSFTSGAITSGDLLSISAGQITTGVINSSGGDTTILSTGVLNIGGITSSALSGSPIATLSGSAVQTGNVQNSSGTMTITSTSGTFSGTGNVENSGDELNIVVGPENDRKAMTVVGTLKNTPVEGNGTLKITAGSLTVSGGNTNNPSFVNAGNATIIVDGLTRFVNGMRFFDDDSGTAMSATDILTIKTGTLDLGTNNIIANEKSTVDIEVKNGALNVGAISNGAENGSSNASAVMTLSGLGVNVTSVQNYGNTLNIGTASSTSNDNIIITGGVIGAANTQTNIVAGNSLSIQNDVVSNSGNMTLSGKNVSLKTVSNSGAGSSLQISAPTDPTGSITVSGMISNANGTTTIESKDVSIGGVLNNSGTMNITGSGTSAGELALNSITVNGGVMNIGVWSNGISAGPVAINGGVLNLDNTVRNFTSNGDITTAGNITLGAGQDSGLGDIYLAATGSNINFKSTNGTLTVGGDIIATDNVSARTATFDAHTLDGDSNIIESVINVNGTNGIVAQNKGKLIFGSNGTTPSTLTVQNGAISATDGGKIEIYSKNITTKSLVESGSGQLLLHGDSLTATGGNISVADGIWFGGSSAAPTTGMIIQGASTFTLADTANNADIIVVANGISVGTGNTLNIQSARKVTVTGNTTIDGTLDIDADGAVTFNDAIDANVLDINAKSITLNGITNNGTTALTATNGKIISNGAVSNVGGGFSAVATDNVQIGNFSSSGNNASVVITSSGGGVTTGTFAVSGGAASITANTSTSLNSLSLTGGTITISSPTVAISGSAKVKGGMNQGSAGSGLSLLNTTSLSTQSLTITNGGFAATNGNTTYTITNAANLGNVVTIASGATSSFTAGSIDTDNITNNGTLSFVTNGGAIKTGDIANSGALTLNSAAAAILGGITNDADLTISANGLLSANSFKNNSSSATANITSNNMSLTGAFNNTYGTLYQGYTGTLSDGDVNITNANYVITTSSMNVDAIKQIGDTSMVINTSSLNVDGDVSANDLTIAANPMGNWSNVNIAGDVSGGVKFIGVEHMIIGHDYIYDDNSMLHVAVLPYGTGSEMNTTTYNYWADVSLAEDNTLGVITNHDNNPNNALVYVGRQFVSKISDLGQKLDDEPLVPNQMGIDLYSIVDQGSAVWLLYADRGLNDLATKIRNLNVNFCNADGTICFNYFNAYSTDITNTANGDTENGLPIYLSVRDYDNDGVNDSLYLVFDPRFGGPVSVFKIEPIVRRVDDRTEGEISAANAIDNMVDGQLLNNGFFNSTPIEAIPIIFNGTNLSELANELYNRMERYVVERDGTALARLSRLVQPRELEQIMGSIALNEHTTFRDFEDRMFDEFIWNRNRNLSKAWFDADYGILRQKGSDNLKISGDRFNLAAGFDWKNSKTVIWGLMARLSHTSSDNSDHMDLGYMPGVSIDGNNSMTVADTDIGVGAYLMKTLGVKTRLYGNVMADMHLFDVSRKQNYVSDIDGSGTAYSVISELGLLHDWLNQYIVGNLYARFGYNFGFSIKEKAAGNEYMRLKSDGYFMLTPGYSLIAQKRIYTSPWFQIRPYASIGIEYDVLGTPDVAKYKFAPSKMYTEYNVEMKPLWANIGGGLELLSANGIQVGLDYRYQYNTDIQLHNLRLSGSIRF